MVLTAKCYSQTKYNGGVITEFATNMDSNKKDDPIKTDIDALTEEITNLRRDRKRLLNRNKHNNNMLATVSHESNHLIDSFTMALQISMHKAAVFNIHGHVVGHLV